MKSLSIALCFLLTACVSSPKIPIIQGNGVMYNKNIVSILERCRFEVATIVIAKYELNPNMTRENVEQLERFLMGECTKYYGAMI